MLGCDNESEELKESDDGLRNLGCYEERKILYGEGQRKVKSELICKTLYGWREAVSPHLAAEKEGATIDDSAFLSTLQRCLEKSPGGEEVDVLSIVETAGGVASPGPSGSLQCDLYRYVPIDSIFEV